MKFRGRRKEMGRIENFFAVGRIESTFCGGNRISCLERLVIPESSGSIFGFPDRIRRIRRPRRGKTVTNDERFELGHGSVMALLNNGTFTGDVWFPISACYLGKGGTPGYLSELTATKLGYIIFLHGPIMWSDADVRDTLRKELDSGKTAFAGGF